MPNISMSKATTSHTSAPQTTMSTAATQAETSSPVSDSMQTAAQTMARLTPSPISEKEISRRLTPETSVLVIVDVQGKLAQIMDGAEALQQSLTTLIQGAQLFDIPILWLEQLPDKLGSTSPALQVILSKSASPIAKQHFSGWRCDAFREQLIKLNRPNVILAGIETHVCVYQTCYDLLAEQYEVHIVADAVSSRAQANKQLGIQMMTSRGAQLTNVESLLFELQHEAQGERFRALLTLIK